MDNEGADAPVVPGDTAIGGRTGRGRGNNSRQRGRGGRGGRGRGASTPSNSSVPIVRPNPTTHDGRGSRVDPVFSSETLFPGLRSFQPDNRNPTHVAGMSAFYGVVNADFIAFREESAQFDRFVSLSMFFYYCVIALWRGLIEVAVKTRCNRVPAYILSELDTLRTLDQKITPLVAKFIASIGTVTFNGDETSEPMILSWPSQLIVEYDLSGSFGVADVARAPFYVILPSPYVAYRQILHDYAFQAVPAIGADWLLPATLSTSGLPIRITQTCLGYVPFGNPITNYQFNELQRSRMRIDAAGNILQTGIQSGSVFCLNSEIIGRIDGYLQQSRCSDKLTTVPIDVHGSLCVIPHAVLRCTNPFIGSTDVRIRSYMDFDDTTLSGVVIAPLRFELADYIPPFRFNNFNRARRFVQQFQVRFTINQYYRRCPPIWYEDVRFRTDFNQRIIALELLSTQMLL